MTNSTSYIVGRRTARGMQYIAYWWNWKLSKVPFTKYAFRAQVISNSDTAMAVMCMMKGKGWTIFPVN